MAEPLYRFNARAGRYRDAAGRFVPQAEVRAEIDRALGAARREMRDLAEQLRTRQIGLDRWEVEMRRQVRRVHLYSSAAAKGGWAQMTPADFGRAGRELRDQYAYLERFTRQLRAGLPKDGRFLSRADLYAEAGRASYHAAERAAMRARGLTEEKNVLHPADHCEQCVAETRRRWVPIGSLTPVGSRLCRARCRCTVSYR